MNMNKLKLISILTIFLLNAQSIFANTYASYIQFGAMKFFHTREFNTVANIDLFIPLWQRNYSDLLFTDLRIHDHSGTPFEGNLHLGYRHLFSNAQKMFGVYGSFDHRKTLYSNYISQIGLGGEFWLNKWFIGANLYQPVGNTLKYLSTNTQKLDIDSVTVREIKNSNFEKAIPGFDFEVGYEFIPGLIGYAGGYYFDARGVDKVCGPRVRLAYELNKYTYGRRVLGIFDAVGLELGVQHDKPRNTIYYASMRIRFGLNDNINTITKGIARHMLDPVRRDIEIISRPTSSSVFIDKKHIPDQLLFLDSSTPTPPGDGGGGVVLPIELKQDNLPQYLLEKGSVALGAEKTLVEPTCSEDDSPYERFKRTKEAYEFLSKQNR